MEPSVTLNSGHKIPMVGYGTYLSKPNEIGECIRIALKEGIRHFDCAEVYHNQKEIGQVFKEAFDSGLVKRSDLFITSKLFATCHSKEHVRKHFDITLSDLQLDYLDLYLIHWPLAMEYNAAEPMKSPMENGYPKLAKVPIIETWRELEKIHDAGLARSIGVSNFNVSVLNDLLNSARIPPSVNQCELHPYWSQPGLRMFCEKNNIHMTAYSPLGKGSIMSDPVIVELAKKYNRSTANILCRFGIQKGYSVIPKSTTHSRIKDNANVKDFVISDSDMAILDALPQKRIIQPMNFWGFPLFD
ncbi:aldehyde reductase [Heterostelium album PN500]|uniref:Aldehyde reductase n=1 Tax=Heterostelium pallidum (strain ATCC 26659 / Pp 5 / PN500) TaxID=670386 RepID=D3BN01_HETP5|nr:aldehyde reductase [Heterostelium album PN500]EFA77363.1 aldehyde reductase [Heterostelium album PN500]|eukprot:XP_020429492.1 aldehyde reductase [Heterostelium album PN500]